MTRTKKMKYSMKGCSRSCGVKGGGGGAYNQNPVYMYNGPKGPFPGWLNSSMQRGGKGQKGGYNGLPYGKYLAPMKAPPVPNGLTGSAWKANFKWPGTDLIQGNFNHFSLNKYVNDVSRYMKDIGAGFPFLKGGKSYRKRKTRKNKTRRYRGGGNTLISDVKGGLNNFLYSNDKFLNNLAGSQHKIQNPNPYVQPALLKN